MKTKEKTKKATTNASELERNHIWTKERLREAREKERIRKEGGQTVELTEVRK